MTKAILVLKEMPKNCYQCPYCDCENNYCELCGEIMETQGERQSWCPLKELPKKKFVQVDEKHDINYALSCLGYNKCLEEILGDEND